jgi:hypothetical protein
MGLGYFGKPLRTGFPQFLLHISIYQLLMDISYNL